MKQLTGSSTISARIAMLVALLSASSACCPAVGAPRNTVHTPHATERDTSITAGATAHDAVVVAPISELRELDLAARVSPYLANNAVWIPGQPVAVNRDFDFGAALTMDSIGPALAAAKRKKDNEQLAAQLSSLAAIDPSALVHELCAAGARDTCTALTARTVRIYGLLFGAPDARLEVVIEAEPTANADRFLHAGVSAAQPLDAYANPGVLAQAFARALAAAASTLDTRAAATVASTSTSPALGRCNMGGRGNVDGTVIEAPSARDQGTLLLVNNALPARLLCPADAFTASAPAPR